MFSEFFKIINQFIDWNIVFSIENYILLIFENWWEVIIFFPLINIFLFFWLQWRQWLWIQQQKWILLEIHLPREILKPIRAMEIVMASLHGAIYDPKDGWDKWIAGECQTSLSFEIASIEGKPHFYIRVHKNFRSAVEASLYSQYPEIEIKEVEDYTKSVPQNIPNKEWDMFGCGYRLLKPNPYPIKTYTQFETEKEVKEEKRIDPMAVLLEGLTKIKKGEQFWIQITATPLAQKTVEPFHNEGKQLKNKIVGRKLPAPPKPMIQEAIDIWLPGGLKTQEKKEEIIPPEMKLTPGEREIVAGIEEKISKPAFGCRARFIYLGKRDVFFKVNFRLGFVFFSSFATSNLNSLVPWPATLSRVRKSMFFLLSNLKFIRERRLYLQCRRMMRVYRWRVNWFFPREKGDKGEFVLNTAELASLFHFPSQIVAPAPIVRVESTKGEAPVDLPIEM